MKSSHVAFWRHTHTSPSFQAPQTNDIMSANASSGLQFKEIVNPAVTMKICGPPEF
jgi:hypothetical protein